MSLQNARENVLKKKKTKQIKKYMPIYLPFNFIFHKHFWSTLIWFKCKVSSALTLIVNGIFWRKE